MKPVCSNDQNNGCSVVYCDNSKGDCLVLCIWPFILIVITKYVALRLQFGSESSAEQKREGECTFIVCLLLVLLFLLLFPAYFNAREDLPTTTTLQVLISTLTAIFLLLHVLITCYFMFARRYRCPLPSIQLVCPCGSGYPCDHPCPQYVLL